MEELQVRGKHHPKAKLPFLTTIGGSLEDSYLSIYSFLVNYFATILDCDKVAKIIENSIPLILTSYIVMVYLSGLRSQY